MTASSASPPPDTLGGFEILRRLGAGGMAEVFLAKKQGAEGTYKILVLKRVLPAHGTSRRFRAMFVEEAQLAVSLPAPPMSVSSPAPPSMTSLPPPPSSTLSPESPVMVSPKFEPVTFSI